MDGAASLPRFHRWGHRNYGTGITSRNSPIPVSGDPSHTSRGLPRGDMFCSTHSEDATSGPYTAWHSDYHSPPKKILRNVGDICAPEAQTRSQRANDWPHQEVASSGSRWPHLSQSCQYFTKHRLFKNNPFIHIAIGLKWCSPTPNNEKIMQITISFGLPCASHRPGSIPFSGHTGSLTPSPEMYTPQSHCFKAEAEAPWV